MLKTFYKKPESTTIEKIFTILLCYNKFSLVFANGEDIFRQDIGATMEIGLSDTGYKTVELRCGSGKMVVNLETKDEFLGVIYTRGSFYDKSPCFYDADDTKQKYFKMEIPFDNCKTKKEGNVYSNVLVLQHDKELIMPGDAAFYLECNFDKPRDVTVSADMQSTSAVASKITLIDADPAKQMTKDGIRTFKSYTNSVIFTPNAAMPKEEL